jgi:hypothetical protein
MPDPTNHPPHYGGEDNPYEAIKVIEALGLGFHLGNVHKYVSRAGKKMDKSELKKRGKKAKKRYKKAVLMAKIQDLKKAKWYLDRKIQTLELKLSSPKFR